MNWFAVLNFDILNSLSVDCLAVQPTLVQKFAFTQLLPLVLLAIIKGVESYQLRGKSEVQRKRIHDTTINQIFVILFLMYPQLSTSVFQIL
eukprot:SAG11_NODE_2518_length_3265_cov_1.241314_3_plen_91_part_00